MLSHILSRLSFSKFINCLVIATTTNPEDKALVDFAKENSVGFYCGSVDDIVDRIYNAAVKFNAEVVVRIWGDCPLIDPKIVDKVIEKLLKGNADYASNSQPPTFPVGFNCEVYKIETLKRIIEATSDAFYRQYPFEYVLGSGGFKVEKINYAYDLSDIYLTVDYPEDLEVISEIFKNIQYEGKIFHMEDVLRFLDKNPGILNTTQNLRRNIEYKEDVKKR